MYVTCLLLMLLGEGSAEVLELGLGHTRVICSCVFPHYQPRDASAHKCSIVVHCHLVFIWEWADVSHHQAHFIFVVFVGNTASHALLPRPINQFHKFGSFFPRPINLFQNFCKVFSFFFRFPNVP